MNKQGGRTWEACVGRRSESLPRPSLCLPYLLEEWFPFLEFHRPEKKKKIKAAKNMKLKVPPTMLAISKSKGLYILWVEEKNLSSATKCQHARTLRTLSSPLPLCQGMLKTLSQAGAGQVSAWHLGGPASVKLSSALHFFRRVLRAKVYRALTCQPLPSVIVISWNRINDPVLFTVLIFQIRKLRPGSVKILVHSQVVEEGFNPSHLTPRPVL